MFKKKKKKKKRKRKKAIAVQKVYPSQPNLPCSCMAGAVDQDKLCLKK
jgi:hypothetical protein